MSGDLGCLQVDLLQFGILEALHISDAHFDHRYQEGSNAEFQEPMRCRETSGVVDRVEDMEGYWGDFMKCDTPLRIIEAMYKHIATIHPSAYWTRDLPAYDIWNQTKEGYKEIVRTTARRLKQFLTNISVYPALGNYESVPVYSYPPPSVTAANVAMSWLYSTLAEVWGEWLGKNHK